MKRTITLLSASIISISTSHAALVATETFDGLSGTPRTFEDTDSTVLFDQNEAGTRVVGPNGDPFGSGNDNLRLGGANLRLGNVGSTTTLTTITFDLYEQSGVGSNALLFGFGDADLNGSGASHAWSINDGAIGLASNTTLSDGSLATLDEDTHYIASLVLNKSGSTQAIEGSAISLDADQSALFFYNVSNGTMTYGGTFDSTGPSPDNFYFRNFSSGDNEIIIDNFSVYDNLVAVPEPSSTALLGLGGLALILRRRK